MSPLLVIIIIFKYKKISMTTIDDQTVQERGGFLIRKETMITKNTKSFKDVYKIGKKPLGSGGFGVVYKCEHRVTK